MKIYTRTGDSGETALFGGGRVPKDHVRVEAYGAVDETNATLGVAIAALENEGSLDYAERLRIVQADLFTIGAHLATPTATEGGRAEAHLPPLPDDRIAVMEAWIDDADGHLEPLRAFVLPGGTPAAAALHLARTVCRRAERRVLSLSRNSTLDPHVIVYLNRLSDLLFTLARLSNREQGSGDVPWSGRT
jgi:cob(I)alamin adenosyltransferase